jgi:glycosyltransferase involved in cell wall biosynthesis
MVHEPFVPLINCRWFLMGIWQRFQLALVSATADVVFASIEPWAEMLASRPPWRPVEHLPVGSNFPDRRSDRAAARIRMGIDEDTLVVATMGRDHPTWRGEEVTAAVNAIADRDHRVVLLVLGADAPMVSGVDRRVFVQAPGYLTDGELATSISAADLFLAPILDGISTRRGTLMVALQHELPVVGSSGDSTDSVLLDSPDAIRLCPARDVAAFANTALCLAGNPDERRALGVAARLLYEQHFDWPIIADRLASTLARA